MAGAYEFAMFPFVYELARRMVDGSLDFSRLDAPEWLIADVYTWLRPVGAGVALLYDPPGLWAIHSDFPTWITCDSLRPMPKFRPNSVGF